MGDRISRPAMPSQSVGALYRQHFQDRRREHLFLALLSFFLTFAYQQPTAYQQWFVEGSGPLKHHWGYLRKKP